MTEPFDPKQPGSFYTLGPKTASGHVVLMHGSGKSALSMKNTAQMLSGFLPQQKIVVPNGYVDTCDPDVPKFRRGKNPGECYDWQFWTDAQWYDYRENKEQNSPFKKIQSHAEHEGPIHLCGFSAGAFGALKEFVENPTPYQSITMIGYHLNDDLIEELIEKAKTDPSIKNKPIFCGFGQMDPLRAFNTNSTISKLTTYIPFNALATFGNRHDAQKKHDENIQKLKDAGFSVEEQIFKRTTHTLSREVLKNIGNFITDQEFRHAPKLEY